MAVLGSFFLAVLSAAATPSPAISQESLKDREIDHLIRDLGSEDVAVRERADRELRKLGKTAQKALEVAAASDDAEVKRRAKAILEWLKVLKVDDQGRVLVERDDKGWNVEYTHDQSGYVIKKEWFNPEDRKESSIRCYVLEAETGRLVQEMDTAGRRKLITYAPDGKVLTTDVAEGFEEEADQIRKMSPPRKPPSNTPPAEK
jgi:YD repeat-containing protein